MATRRLAPAVRLRAWLVTGPLGHLVAGLADVAGFAWRVARARLRGTDPWG